MIFNYLTLLPLLAPSLISATAIPSNRNCKDLDIPITVTASNGIYSFPTFTTNEEVTDTQFYLALRNAPQPSPSGYVNITGTYTINARFCTPKKSSPKSNIIHLLTHGVGFDKSYWDPTVSRTNYSYIDTAISAGYSTFSYDRLANGKSTKPNGNTAVQSFTELSILIHLTRLLRNNTLNLTPASKIVHVGHSYGSVLSNYLAAAHPELSDALVLTGYSHNLAYITSAITTWGFQIARLQAPRKFAEFGSEYFTWANKWANQLFFWKYPFFSNEALDYAEDNKQPVGLGVLMSLGGGNTFAGEFEGPVLVITGQYDLPFCGGNCTGILEASEEFFPASRGFETVVHPDAGHGINLHLNAQVAYKSILDFLERSGL